MLIEFGIQNLSLKYGQIGMNLNWLRMKQNDTFFIPLEYNCREEIPHEIPLSMSKGQRDLFNTAEIVFVGLIM